VVPVDGAPIRDGRVVVEGDRIVWVGSPGEPDAPTGTVCDLGPGVLLPGLVNAHCHLELSHLAGVAPLGEGFVPWVEALVGARPGFDEDEVRTALETEIAGVVERGTAGVGDISNRLDHVDLLTASGLAGAVFLEVLAWDPARVAETEAWIGERLARAAPRAGGRVRVRLAAHAPHSVSPELLRRLAEREHLGSVHLAESPEESRYLRSGDGEWAGFLRRRGLGHVAFEPPGESPVQYVDGLGLLRPGLLAVHGVHLDDADRQTLARRGVSVALCPRSNRNLGVGQADAPALLEAGVPLCLGTDSLASVETLDVLDEAAELARQFPGLDAGDIVRMATAGGAEALGLEDLGTLAPGKRAAFAFVPADVSPEDPFAYLVSGSARPRRVEVE
jgi:cytosine/adenosine deaminase-related metal-dependent hydrolase